ncbi:MAG: hypothetical protein ACX94C_06525 [Phycisphaerales bacterium]
MDNMHISLTTIVFILACLVSRASAQNYDWTIENLERVYERDSDTVRVTRTSLSHINMTVESVSNGQIRFTINTLDITVPDTPIGDMGFDSAKPRDPTNPLETVMRPLVGMTFTLTYDLHDRVLKASDNLLQARGTAALGQTLAQPFLTAPFAAFFIYQQDATPDKPRSFMLAPYANGVQLGEPQLIDYITSESGSEILTEADLSMDASGDIPGASSTARIVTGGSSSMSHNGDRFVLRKHELELKSELRFDIQPGMPVRSELVTKILIEHSHPKGDDVEG